MRAKKILHMLYSQSLSIITLLNAVGLHNVTIGCTES
jgi:hypothetical protein